MKFNFDAFKEQYGTEFAERVQEDINYCKEDDLDWKIVLIDEIEGVLFKIAFVTYVWAHVWEVNTKVKRISSEDHINYKVADKVWHTMQSLKAK